jgi:hypothetical protein
MSLVLVVLLKLRARWTRVSSFTYRSLLVLERAHGTHYRSTVAWHVGKFLSSCTTSRFSRRAQHYPYDLVYHGSPGRTSSAITHPIPRRSILRQCYPTEHEDRLLGYPFSTAFLFTYHDAATYHFLALLSFSLVVYFFSSFWL